jgi:hypothetical protein
MKNPIEIGDRASTRAIHSDKTRLAKTKSGKSYYKLEERERRATIIFVPPKGKEVDDIAEYTAELLNGLDDRTADVLKLLHSYGREFKNKNGYFWAYANDILNDLGTKPMTKSEHGKVYNTGHRTEDIQEINRHVQHLRGLKLIVGTVILNGKKLKKPLVHKGYLLVVTEELTSRRTDRVYAWKCKFYDGLEDLVKNERFYNVFRKALTYDPLRRSPEKRISSYADEGFRLNGNRAFGRRVSTMVEAMNLPYDEKRPQMSINRIELALNRLVADNGIGDWGYLISKGEYTKELTFSPRRVWEEYQNLMLWFFPPSGLPQIAKPKKIALNK